MVERVLGAIAALITWMILSDILLASPYHIYSSSRWTIGSFAEMILPPLAGIGVYIGIVRTIRWARGKFGLR